VSARALRLKPGKAKPLWHGHPWVYADSVASLEGGEGDLVRVEGPDGAVLGRGWLSPASAIRVRMLTRGADETPEEDVLQARVAAAVALRRRLLPDPARTDAYRLVHGEADGLPGLVVDRFGPVLVAQFSTRPLLSRRPFLAARLLAETGAASLVSRAGGKEDEEGIAPDEVAFAAGDPAPDAVTVREEGLVLVVDLRRGQKTGHYVDQRENRRLVGEAARGGRVLDLYAGTGGFSLQALAQGAASALAVDASAPALEAATANARANGLTERLATARGDALEHARALARAGEAFDLVVADPPRFAATRAGLEKALFAYRSLNAVAMARVAADGFLATFSCSGLVTREAFEEVVRAASRECRRPAAVLRTLAAGPDHPVSLAAPEGRYLTGLLLRVGPALP
jgi:23S rRNA (cytosine1962-C5)-methyltransferase